ncbi:MAG: 3-deoxy-manno-octulosonate cytidylyltransferase [Deltaproteobacteria bacterium]|nr:3-deoxy-manno-octulosonate cytidylyltransferase [Deltaproteobacteria bacterium]
MSAVMIVIPARYASTRFPGKPLALLRGRPLLSWVLARCRQASGAARVLVATDDRRIMEAAREEGAAAEMTAAGHRSGTERLAEVAARHPEISWFINVQGDEPEIDPELINRLIAELRRRDDPATIVTARCPLDSDEDFHSPHVVKVVADLTGRALYFSRAPIPCERDGQRSDSPAASRWQHLGIYGYHRSFLEKLAALPPGELERAEQLEQLRWLENGYRIQLLDAPKPSIGVDTPEELARLEERWRTDAGPAA